MFSAAMAASILSAMPRFSDRKSTRLNSSHTVIYTLSLHDALPILLNFLVTALLLTLAGQGWNVLGGYGGQYSFGHAAFFRSEEHTSELQSHRDLHSFPTRRSSDLAEFSGDGAAADIGGTRLECSRRLWRPVFFRPCRVF